MEQNLNGLGVGSHDDELRDAAVQGLGRCSGEITTVVSEVCMGAVLYRERGQDREDQKIGMRERRDGTGTSLLRTFVGALLELLVVACLLDNVQDGVGQLRREAREL